jgi:pimeloyl-ACP methyl ester carboxylesterase
LLSTSGRVLYLHGFASGPGSKKAGFFRSRLEELGYRVDIPDLSEGRFEQLTITGQLNVIERALKRQPAILIGSSLGGYLASVYAARHPEIERLILLAPAFNFYTLWTSDMPPERVAEWKQKGTIEVFHYGAGREMALGYGLLEDAKTYEGFPDVRQPTVIFHGKADTSVPLESSIRFVEGHENARLVRVESSHELTDVLDLIWGETEKFLTSGGPVNAVID